MYNSEDISKAMSIYYYLLQHGELSIEDDRKLYRAYSESEETMLIVKLYGEQSNCTIERYNGIIYIIPKDDNEFLGFSKAELKKELCRSNGSDKDYYLSQFVILTLLSTFYNSNGRSSKSRSFIKFGDFMNILSERLKAAADYEELDTLEKKSSIAVSNIIEMWTALKGSDERTTSKTTKLGFLIGIIKFLEKQKLVDYIEADDMIKPTIKLDNFMDWNILNKNNYEKILLAFEELEGAYE